MSAQVPNQTVHHPLSVAPMLKWTDLHCRYLMRLISSHTLLYTEMVTTGALIYGDRDRYLAYNAEEHPVCLQLGGSDPEQLAVCSKMVEAHGYDEVNLNLGCPSDRVQSGQFGACLMLDHQRVKACIEAMIQSVSIPVTAKIRIGVDEQDSYSHLYDFTAILVEAGCKTIIVHARKAWLNGLSPKENREIPPLDYPAVYRLKQDFPDTLFVINGGIETFAQIEQQYEHVDGVMVGRAAYHNPYLLAEADQKLYGSTSPIKSRHQIAVEYCDYIEQQCSNGVRLNKLSRHILGLFQGEKGAKRFRRMISENAHKDSYGPELIHKALYFTCGDQAA
ncbi:MAG: tRNA dihydrouridine(20/20a) synthase DusA [Pseudomonadales bacterium]|nr:tRNA dihydrouridine(20/20a) synthase DusA [Pseudomonadales bacterium]